VGTNLDAHVWVFRKANQANEERNDPDIVNLFCFTLKDAISKWGRSTFVKLKETFYKHYQKLRTNEQVYMALRVIKQTSNEKVKVYLNMY
jgi:hypothetical protein